MQKPFAEIISSSLTEWTAQTWRWDDFPEFGSLVIATSKDYTTFGIVTSITTGSLDAGRHPFTYQKTEEELLREQPQIFEFLKTTFTCIAIGFQHKGSIAHHIQPKPAKIHAFVAPCPPELLKDFLATDHYLHILFAHIENSMHLDELLLAIIKQMKHHSILHETRLEKFIDLFALLIDKDYRRLKLFIHKAVSLL